MMPFDKQQPPLPVTLSSLARCFLCASFVITALVTTSLTAAENPALTPAAKTEGWWQDRHASFLAKAKAGGVDALFLGDSITQGWEAAGSEAWQFEFAPFRPANFGINADRIEHLLWRITNGELDGITPKVIVLLIGTNNLKGGTTRQTPAEIRDGVASVLHELRQRLPGSTIILCGILPRQTKKYDWMPATLKETNTLLANLADGNHVRFLDMTSTFALADGTLVRGLYQNDELHLQNAGYWRWADALLPLLKPLMGVKVPDPELHPVKPSTLSPRAGQSLAPLVPDLCPAIWVAAGPVSWPTGLPLPNLASNPAFVPGDAAPVGDTNTMARALSDADRFTDSSYTAGMSAIDLTSIHTRATGTVSLLCTVLTNDTPRTVQFRLHTPGGRTWNPPSRIQVRAWLGTQELNERDSYRLEPGVYPMQVVTALVRCDSWGRLWIAPRLIDAPPRN